MAAIFKMSSDELRTSDSEDDAVFRSLFSVVTTDDELGQCPYTFSHSVTQEQSSSSLQFQGQRPTQGTSGTSYISTGEIGSVIIVAI